MRRGKPPREHRWLSRRRRASLDDVGDVAQRSHAAVDGRVSLGRGGAAGAGARQRLGGRRQWPRAVLVRRLAGLDPHVWDVRRVRLPRQAGTSLDLHGAGRGEDYTPLRDRPCRVELPYAHASLPILHTWNAPPFGERDSARFAPARARLSSASTVSIVAAHRPAQGSQPSML